MIPYYFVLFLFFVIWLIGSFYNDYKQSRLIECIFGFIILTILLGIRDSSVGVDLERYISTYNDLNPEFFFSGNLLNKVSFTEPGYLVYIAVLKILGFTSFGYVFITSAIIISSYAVFIYRYSSSVTLSFFIFITFGLMAISMSTLRQSLSIAFLDRKST